MWRRESVPSPSRASERVRIPRMRYLAYCVGIRSLTDKIYGLLHIYRTLAIPLSTQILQTGRIFYLCGGEKVYRTLLAKRMGSHTALVSRSEPLSSVSEFSLLTEFGFCAILSSSKSSPLAPLQVFTAACKVRWVEDSFSALKL